MSTSATDSGGLYAIQAHRYVVLAAWRTTSWGTGIRFVPVEHEGNRVASDEETIEIARLVETLKREMFTDSDGCTRRLRDDDFMVVAPYNAQVRRLRAALSPGLCGSAPSTSFRVNRYRSSSSQWQLPAAKTCRAILRFFSPVIGSTSPSRAPSVWPIWSARRGFLKLAVNRSRRWNWSMRFAGLPNTQTASECD